MTDPCAAGCVRGHGDRCHALVGGHRRFCELIAMGREDYGQLVDRLTRGESLSGIASVPAPIAPLPPDPIGDRIRACRHWTAGNCSCGLDLCTFPWRRRKVAMADCVECLGLVHEKSVG